MREAFFTVYGEPFGKERPRMAIASGTVYTPRKTITHENWIRWSYVAEYQGGEGYLPDDSELLLEITAYYKIPGSQPKHIQAKMLEGLIKPTKRPDIDNIIKIVADALNGLAYKDDKQIVSCSCQKLYGARPRLEVRITDLKERKRG